MKILLDENIDIRLKNYFPEGLTVFTVKDMGWNGINNGALLKLIGESNFEVWIVVDKNIPYQQNILKLPCLVIVLDVLRNTLKNILPLMPQIKDELMTEVKPGVVIID
jgi:hypothetical protein